jgi:hypothetical protein
VTCKFLFTDCRGVDQDEECVGCPERVEERPEPDDDQEDTDVHAE